MPSSLAGERCTAPGAALGTSVAAAAGSDRAAGRSMSVCVCVCTGAAGQCQLGRQPPPPASRLLPPACCRCRCCCSVWGNLVDGYGTEAKRLRRRGIPLLSLQNKCDAPPCPPACPPPAHPPAGTACLLLHNAAQVPTCRAPAPRACFDLHCWPRRWLAARLPACLPPLARLACRMVWWVGCPLALASAAFAFYGWAGLTFAVGQAVIR